MITGFKGHTWRTGTGDYEGFPLLLRYPDDVAYEEPVPAFPVLLTITHSLSHVQPSGLPEKEYNQTLEDFDVELGRCFESRGLGVEILVETFGGKRMYYFYVVEHLDLIEEQATIREKYPQHDLCWEHSLDPGWHFIQRYARDFKFKRAQPTVPADDPGASDRR